MSSIPTKQEVSSQRSDAFEPWPAVAGKEEQVTQIVDASLGKPNLPQIEVISAEPHWIELLIPCTRDAAERIQPFLASLDADLSAALRQTVGIALRELLQNAIEWGGNLDPNRKVRVAHLRFPRMLLYRIADPGPGFHFKNLRHAVVGHTSPEQMAEVAIMRAELGLRPGGYGIALSQAIADELVYNEAQNEVVLIKYLGQPRAAEPSS